MNSCGPCTYTNDEGTTGGWRLAIEDRIARVKIGGHGDRTSAFARGLLLLCQKMLHDFPTRGAPYTVMRADILECRVERADTMRLPGDERVHRDRHDARHGLALAVQRIELALQHRLKFGH